MRFGDPWRWPVAALAALGLLAAACTSERDSVGRDGYYVSLGDSYAIGAQVKAVGPQAATRNGYADQVIGLARDRGLEFTLVNFGCGGATTETMLDDPGCSRPPVDGSRYRDESQLDAAVAFMDDHRGDIGLITIAIGGNEIIGCFVAADPDACYADAVDAVGPNLDEILGRVRAAVGDEVPVIGLTYPNVVLGAWTRSPDRAKVIDASTVFDSTLNPMLRSHYEAVGAVFVDVTEATGGNGDLDETTTVDPYGEIPVPVARVCALTFACEFNDAHATTDGYRVMAELVVDALED